MTDHAQPTVLPHVGQIVTYRSKTGVEMAAIITACTLEDPGYAHLQIFPPPGHAADTLNHTWGAPCGQDPGCWQPLAPAAAEITT